MNIRPFSAFDALGLQSVRERLATSARSEAGRNAALSLAPFPEFSSACDELQRVGALQALYEAGDAVPDTAFDQVADEVRAAQPVGSYLEPEGLHRIRLTVECSSRLRSFFLGRAQDESTVGSLAAMLEPVPELSDAISKVIADDGEVRDNASPELRRIRGETLGARAQVRKAVQRALRNASGEGWAAEEQPTIRGGRMVIPVRAEAKRKVRGIVHDVSASGQTAFVEPSECVELNNDLRTLEAEERREIVRLLTSLTTRVREATSALLANDRALAYLDVLAAKARWARHFKAVIPERGDEGIIELRAARNPELEDRIGSDAVIPLDIRLDGEGRMLVISGPNAGGKSVALKTVGLLVALVSCGLPIPAEEGSRIDRLDQLLVDIGDEQSLENDLSTFSSHLTHWQEMVESADERSLVLIDEAGTGTDPDEGSALAQATLEAILRKGARAVVTTHHGPLKRFAHETPGVSNGMMRFNKDALEPTYRFESGVPGASYAFEIAERMGLDRSVTERARNLLGVDRVAFEQLLAELQEKNILLERSVLEARKTARDADARRSLLQNRLERLQEARGEIEERALEQAQDLLSRANAAVERTIREIKESQASKEATQASRQALEEFRTTVEHQKRRTSRKRSKARAHRKKAKKSDQPLQVGDQVVLDGSGGSGGSGGAGELLEVQGDQAVVAMGNARLRVAVNRLRKVGGKRTQKVTIRQSRPSSGGLTSSQAQTKADVRGKRVDEAISETIRLVDQGLMVGLKTVEILHGKGTGALRAAIHEYLETRRDISGYSEAPIEGGGAGVTIVRF